MALVVNVNDKLEIYNLKDEKLGETKIQDVVGNHIFMGVPFAYGTAIPLSLGRRIKVIYYSKNNKIYEFTTEIVDRKKDTVLMYQIKFPESFHQVQRRKSVRIPVVLEVSYQEYDDELEDNLNKFKDDCANSCFSVDLSASGAGLIINEPMEKDQQLMLSLQIEDREIDVIGKTVRIEESIGKNEEQVKVGVEFQDLKYAVEEKLTNFVFNEMRKQMKRR